jgi:uncharacterized protein (TIGR02145 family)
MKNLLSTITILLSIVTVTSAQVTDKDGKTYKTVEIGTQTWMAENLNVSRFRNGDLIPEAKTNEEWKKANDEKKPAWCYYNNDPANGLNYGKLYNGYAITDLRNLAPDGWQVPDETGWNVLIKNSGGTTYAGQALKSVEIWKGGEDFKYSKGTNSSGFSGLPGGLRSVYGDFKSLNYSVNWWCSVDKLNEGLLHVSISFADSFTSLHRALLETGYSVRCVKK